MAPDIASELKHDTDQLRAILTELDKITPPELTRPDVPHGKPATEELIHWACRAYVYSILCHFREILRSTLLLYDSQQVPAVFLCCRALFEIAAHVYYVRKHIFQYLSAKDYEQAWNFTIKVNAGSRYMVEKYGEKLDRAIPLEESPHIQKAVAALNEYFKEQKKAASETYSFLSEFCHPNSFAFSHHIDLTDSGKEQKMIFDKPSTDLSIQAIPSAILSSMIVLSDGAEMLHSCKDTGLDEALTAFLKITDGAIVK